MKLVYRVLVAAAVLPLVAAGVIPSVIIIFDPWRQRLFIPGFIVLSAGIALTAVCIRDFYKRGGGTLAPWDAPVNLVVTGPYRYCRNPMYGGVLITIAGLALFFSSPLLLLYNIAAGFIFHMRIIKYEEPELQRLFGKRWVIYTAMVNRWFPGFK